MQGWGRPRGKTICIISESSPKLDTNLSKSAQNYLKGLRAHFGPPRSSNAYRDPPTPCRGPPTPRRGIWDPEIPPTVWAGFSALPVSTVRTYYLGNRLAAFRLSHPFSHGLPAKQCISHENAQNEMTLHGAGARDSRGSAPGSS